MGKRQTPPSVYIDDVLSIIIGIIFVPVLVLWLLILMFCTFAKGGGWKQKARI